MKTLCLPLQGRSILPELFHAPDDVSKRQPLGAWKEVLHRPRAAGCGLGTEPLAAPEAGGHSWLQVHGVAVTQCKPHRVGLKVQSCNSGPAAATAVTQRTQWRGELPDTGIFHVPTEQSYPTSRWTRSSSIWLSAVQFWVRLLYSLVLSFHPMVPSLQAMTGRGKT